MEQAGATMTLDTVNMLATCSDQANKSKVMGAKGLSDVDPLGFLREKLANFGEEEPNGQA